MNKITEGFTSEIFEIDTGKVLKLYKPEFAAVAKIEYEKMQQLRKFGIKMPVVYEHRITDGRHGYIMDKIEGRSLSEELLENAGDLDFMIRRFVELQNKINTISVNDECFSSQVSVIVNRVTSNKNIEEGKREIILRFLSKQNSINLCHNDFHFNNIIVEQNVFYVIDWNGAFAGNWLLDIAKTWVILNLLPFKIGCNEKLAELKSHIVSQYILECARLYKFDNDDFMIFVLIRLAELTSLHVPEMEKLLLYFNQNSHLLVEL